MDTAEWRNEFEAANAPGLPSADSTISTTRITAPEEIAANMERAIITACGRSIRTVPLVVMTVLTQLSVGPSARSGCCRASAVRAPWWLPRWRRWPRACSRWAASTLHLGRPIHAYRALRMWRRSWLSREVLLFTLSHNAGATLVVVDPRVTKTGMLADLHLPLKPRTDIALLNGIIHVVIRDGTIDAGYIERCTSGFDELRKSVERYTPEYTAEITGLNPETIYRVAMLYGRAKAPTIAWTMGVNHSTQGTETVNAINNLALITGNVGRTGASPLSITGQCNAMGTRETGFTSSMPGYRKFDNEQHRNELAELWGIDADLLPRARGLAYPDIIEGAVGGRICALWILATNPIVSFPNLDVLRQGLERLDFLVVQDGYRRMPISPGAPVYGSTAVSAWTTGCRRRIPPFTLLAPDGKWIYFGRGTDVGVDIYRVAASGGATTFTGLQTSTWPDLVVPERRLDFVH